VYTVSRIKSFYTPRVFACQGFFDQGRIYGQIAHLLAQLLYKATLLKRDFPGGFGSAKNLAFRLLEAWRYAPTAESDITTAPQERFQIRFDSS
jgi:hypothetical protein